MPNLALKQDQKEILFNYFIKLIKKSNQQSKNIMFL